MFSSEFVSGSRNLGQRFAHLATKLALTLGIALDEALQGEVGATELLHLGELLLNTSVCRTARLFSSVDDFQNGLVILTPVLLDASLLMLGIFTAISVCLQLVDRLQNLSKLLCGDGIRLTVLLSLQDIAIVAETLLVGLLNDMSGSQNRPGVINTTLVILDGFGVTITEILIIIWLSSFCLGNCAIEGEIRGTSVSLIQNALVVLLGHQVGHLLVGQGSAGRSDRVNDLL